MNIVLMLRLVIVFFKHKTAYEMGISDWSSDVCSSDLRLDDYTDAAALREQALLESQLKDMHARFRPEQLGPSARLSYRLFEYDAERRRDSFRFRARKSVV